MKPHKSYPTPYEEKPILHSPKMTPLQESKTPLHDKLGVSPKYTRTEYMKIVNQDENLPVKLKALTPLARELGLDPDPQSVNPSTQIIFMMPQAIAQKHQLIREDVKIIDSK